MENKEKTDYPIIISNIRGVLNINKQIEEQIDLLHTVVGAKEWSGVLLYTVNGDVDSNVDVDVKGLFPMDIGTSAYTEYEFDENIMDMYDMYPNALDEQWRLGHIHTHHNMKAYFSGTDNQELKDNTPNHAYYLSLIVNFDKSYCARLCFMGTREVKGTSSVSVKGIKLSSHLCNNNKVDREEDVIYAIDLDIVMPKKDSNITLLGEINKIQNKNKLNSKLKYESKYVWGNDWNRSSNSIGFRKQHNISPLRTYDKNVQLTLQDGINDAEGIEAIPEEMMVRFMIDLISLGTHKLDPSLSMSENGVIAYSTYIGELTMEEVEEYFVSTMHNDLLYIPMLEDPNKACALFSQAIEWLGNSKNMNEYLLYEFISGLQQDAIEEAMDTESYNKSFGVL